MVRQRLALTHQQMTPPPAPVAINPYHEDDLIFVMTTPPERTSKLAPRRKGPFLVKRVRNAYQVTYEDDMVWRTVHINHVKPAKTPAGGFPVPMSPPDPPSPPPMYLSRNLQWKRPAKPPQPAAPAAGPLQPAAAPLLSRPTTRSSARHQLAPHSEPSSPATPTRTSENSQAGQPLRRSARLNANSRITWIYDPHSSQSHHIAPRQTAPKINTNIVSRKSNNKVPKNNESILRHQSHAQNSRETIPSTSSPCRNMLKHTQAMPRNNIKKNNKSKANNSPQTPKRKRDRRHRRERERENRNESFIHDARWANQRSLVPASSSVPVTVTQSDPQDSDPISSMRTAVYPPLESVGNSTANENLPFQIGRESREFPGLYKPAVPDQQQDTWAYSSAANSSEIGPPSPTRTSASNRESRTRTGIIYPLQPRSRRPDVCIEVEASLPEPAALPRPDLRQPESPLRPQEAPANLPRPYRRLSRKRRRNRSTAVFRPAKRSPPRGHWCDKV